MRCHATKQTVPSVVNHQHIDDRYHWLVSSTTLMVSIDREGVSYAYYPKDMDEEGNSYAYYEQGLAK